MTNASAAPPASDSPAPPARRRHRIPVGVEIIVALAAVALVQAFLVRPFGVPSQSMENTLHIGDRILVNRLDSTIDRGDVVVFGHGETWEQARRAPASDPLRAAVRAVGDVLGMGPSNTAYTVKRVIGLPGESVSCCSTTGAVEIGGTPLTEGYLFEDLPFTPGTNDCSTTPRSARCFAPISIPEDSYLVMGDHRSQSADSVVACRGSARESSCAKFVHRDRIVGPVVATFWPLDRIGSIP